MEHGRSIKEIFPEFMEAISSNPILTYNGTTFDIIFIQKDLERESLDADLASHTYIDAFDIERRVNSNKLSEVYMRYYGKPFEDAHDSSADVDATIDVYMEQQRRYSDRINPDTGTSILAESQADVTRTTTVSPEGFVYMDNDGIMKFRVGKYKEYPVYQVCINDPGYIKWLFEPRNGDNVISNITKRAIRNMYYMEQNKESNK
jgi:DNA polymerase III epsilon subunit-like protein